MDSRPTRPWHRLHWGTWGVLAVVAGALVWTQVTPTGLVSEFGTRTVKPESGTIVEMTHRHGWPCVGVQSVMDLRQNLVAPVVGGRPPTRLSGPARYGWFLWPLAVDATLALLLLVVAGATAEVWYRRHWITGVVVTVACVGMVWSQAAPRFGGGAGGFRHFTSWCDFGAPFVCLERFVHENSRVVPKRDTVTDIKNEWRIGALLANVAICLLGAFVIGLVVERVRRACVPRPQFGLRALLILTLVIGVLLTIYEHWFAHEFFIRWYQVAVALAALGCAGYLAFDVLFSAVSCTCARMRHPVKVFLE